MKTKALSLFVLIFVLILSACSPFAVVSSSGEQPAPEVEAMPIAAAQEYNLIAVEDVEVQVGVGSPIPVEIVASGTWPDLCAQIAEVKSQVNGFQIDVTVLAGTSESCPPDHLGLPFRFALPLNIVEMPDGVYTITVNGTSTTFELPVSQ
jgi:antitoxin component of MazEF toxin-antitoxin module